MEIKENIQLNGVIKIDNKIVAQANAVVSSETGTATSYNESINDYPTYILNKELCRAQFDEFQLKVRQREDEILEEYHTPEEIIEPEVPAEDNTDDQVEQGAY